jgi:hypothetical protein
MARKKARKQPAKKSAANSAKRRRAASEQAKNRTEGGRFAKGTSGNPGGRPKENERVKLLAQAHTEAAIATLAKWMRSKQGKVAVAAANSLLDRGWGKPVQAITGEGGGPLDVNVNEVRGAIASKLDRIADAIAKAGVSK